MSVTLSLFAGAGAQFLDNNGLPLSGGLIYTYSAGTTTPLETYTTNLGTIAQSNPIVLNASGRIPTGELWLTTGYGYKFITKDVNGVLIGTYDNVPSSAQPPITNDTSSIAYEPAQIITAGNFIIGNTYCIVFVGTTNFQTIGATSNTVGTHFIATGIGTGTGTVNYSRTAQSKLRETVSSADFGAVGDGTTDDTVALQNAINYCITYGKKLKILVGTYIISFPLLIAKLNGTSFDYFGLDIEGERYVGADGSGNNPVTTIKATFNNTFAIGIQKARGVRIANLQVVGVNDFSAAVYANTAVLMTNSTYVINGCRDSRYSPYSGIVIDPFGYSVPSDGGYPGLTQYYNSSADGSGGCEFTGIFVSAFVAGIIFSPNGTSINADNTSFIDCAVNFAKCGFVICQSQSRVIEWNGGSIFGCLYGFDSQTYGLQRGYSPGINGSNMGYCKYLFNVGSRWGNSQSIRNIHAESFASLGFFGFGTSQGVEPISFTGCEFNSLPLGAGLYPDHYLVTYTPLIFTGCYFDYTNEQVLRIMSNPICAVVFDTCFMNIISETYNDVLMGFSNNANYGPLYNDSNVIFKNCITRDYLKGNNNLSAISLENIIATSYTFDKNLIPIGAKLKYTAQGNANDMTFCGGFPNYVLLNNLSLTIISTGVGQITVPDGTLIAVGDLIVNGSNSTLYEDYTGALLLVDQCCSIGVASNVVGNIVTIAGLPQNLVAGTYPFYSVWFSRYHLPSTGTTSTSTSITSVTNPSTWAIGQHIQGAGIVTGTYITNNVPSGTLTLSKATTASATGVRLYDADMQLLTGTAI